MTKTETKTPAPTLEELIAELDQIVRRMESQEQPLENTLEDFARGMKLAGQCRERLRQAEQKIAVIMEENGMLQEKPFPPPAA